MFIDGCLYILRSAQNVLYNTTFSYPMTDFSPSSHIATLYRFFAYSMQYPQPDWFTDEYLNNLYLLLDTLGAEQEKEKIISVLSASDDLIEDLQIEYTRLFINGVPHVVAPPYGSVYLDKSLQGQHAEKIVSFYADHGYTLKDGSELPDHLIHQLEFLSLLADKGDAEAETTFLETLFLPWFGRFHDKIQLESKHPFYTVLIHLIDYLTKEEDEHGIQLDEA